MDEMKLIGIDLDGTLLNSDQSISQKNARTMQHLPKDCFPFICSGRDINNILKKSGLMVPAVGLNGSVGFDGEKKIFESFFDKKDVKKLILSYRNFQLKYIRISEVMNRRTIKIK